MIPMATPSILALRHWNEVERGCRSTRPERLRSHCVPPKREPTCPQNTSKIRRAVPGDVDIVQRVSADAYIPAYMSVLGTLPKPATEDYRPRIERGEVWILEIDREPTGIVVLEGNAEHLLIYSIAVKPDAQRKGYGRAWLDFADERAIELRLGRSSALLERADGTKPNAVSTAWFRRSRKATPSKQARTGARRHGSEIAFA